MHLLSKSTVSYGKMFSALLGGYLLYITAEKYTSCPKKQGITDRDDLSQKDVDEIVEESFPASDAPSTY